MSISIEDIKKLKEVTGVGLTEAKKALVEADGNFDKAMEEMRKKGLTRAEKRGEREAREGVIDSYIHGDRVGVLVEVNCETDFVARTEEFRDLAHNVSLHIAAMNPMYVSIEDVPAEEKDRKAAEFVEKAKNEGKPENMIEQIAEGMVKKYFAELCLLEQPFVKEQTTTVGEFVKQVGAKLGENIVIRRFSRLELGVE